MTKWAKSLIRISTFEVETLQKQLAEVATRRTCAEMRIATLDAEAELERERARTDASSNMMLPAYLKGWRVRRDQAVAQLDLVQAEEDGIRDSLSRAFEELKKFEHVAKATQLAKVVADNKREAAQMDEAALRRVAG
ncbi:MAG: flagellar FliJ family protein [Asticcacaulis sp.]